MGEGLVKKTTQCARLKAYMEEHGQITTLQAIIELGIINPAARVMELRAAGITVITRMHEGRNRFDEPCRFAVYSIAK